MVSATAASCCCCFDWTEKNLDEAGNVDLMTDLAAMGLVNDLETIFLNMIFLLLLFKDEEKKKKKRGGGGGGEGRSVDIDVLQ